MQWEMPLDGPSSIVPSGTVNESGQEWVWKRQLTVLLYLLCLILPVLCLPISLSTL